MSSRRRGREAGQGPGKARPAPKAVWGQNFLVDGRVAAGIVSCAGIARSDTVLEIGPGKGALTGHLLRSGARVVGVEIDPALCENLRCSLGKEHPNLEVHNADVLRCRLADLCDKRMRVVTNAPYYISSDLLGLFREQGESIADIHVMFQREVGESLLAQPGSKDYSRISVLMSLTHEIEQVMEVPRACFSPEPQVDSVVLRMRPTRRVDAAGQRGLDRLLRAAFRHRRKKLRNVLAGTPAGTAAQEAGIDLDLRADQVAPEDYMRLAASLGRS